MLFDKTITASQADQANDFLSQLNIEFTRDTKLANRIREFVWANPAGLTPQQVFDLFGTDAAKLVAISSAFDAMAVAVTGSKPFALPNGVMLTLNPDGSVAVKQA